MASISGSSRSGRKDKSNKDVFKKNIVTSNIIGLERKLKKVAAYKDESSNYIRRLAQQLSNPTEITNIYFSTIAHDLIHQTIKHSMDMATGVHTPYEQRAHTIRSAKRVDEVAKFEVKLMLRHVDNRRVQPEIVGRVAAALNMEYGPLHAFLLINDHILVEWSDTSVIVPRIVDPAEDIVKLASATVQNIPRTTCHVSGPFQVENETDIVFDAARQKLELVNRLATVIARYNNQHTYDTIFRNCQNFVLDALAGLGCSETPKFSEGMKKYFKHLRENGKILVEFDSHEKLDRYVEDNMSSLSGDNIEYLLTQYFLLHNKAIIQVGFPRHWECPYPQCMAGLLEVKIKERILIMSKYLHIQHT